MCWLANYIGTGVIGPGTHGPTTVPGPWSLGTVAVGMAQVSRVSTCAYSLWNWHLGFTQPLLWLVRRGRGYGSDKGPGMTKVHWWLGLRKAECSKWCWNGRLKSQVSPHPSPPCRALTGWQWYTPSGCLLELCIETPRNWAQGMVARPWQRQLRASTWVGGSRAVVAWSQSW